MEQSKLWVKALFKYTGGNIRQLGYDKAGKSLLWASDALMIFLVFRLPESRGLLVHSKQVYLIVTKMDVRSNTEDGSEQLGKGAKTAQDNLAPRPGAFQFSPTTGISISQSSISHICRVWLFSGNFSSEAMHRTDLWSSWAQLSSCICWGLDIGKLPWTSSLIISTTTKSFWWKHPEKLPRKILLQF